MLAEEVEDLVLELAPVTIWMVQVSTNTIWAEAMVELELEGQLIN